MTSRVVSLATVDFKDPEYIADPYPTYAASRGEPTVRHRTLGVWVTTSHRAAAIALQSRQFGPAPQPRNPNDHSPRSLQAMTGAAHTRLKRHVVDAFQPAAVGGLEGIIEQRLVGLLERLPRGAVFDGMECVAHPLAAGVIGSMLGLPERDLPVLVEAAMTVARRMGPARDPADLSSGRRAMQVVIDRVTALAGERSHGPADDLTSRLVTTPDLTLDEGTTMVRLLFFTGAVPMALAIGNALLAFLTHPTELERLRAQPELLTTAVEECLRFDSVVQLEARRAMVDTTLDGHPVEAGTEVALLLGAANRDELVFSRPDEFDVTRQPNPHLAFGRGEHTCLGLHLARAELAAVVRHLLLGRRHLRLAGPAEPNLHLPVVLRGLRSLPLIVD